jgi:hypothetical protein
LDCSQRFQAVVADAAATGLRARFSTRNIPLRNRSRTVIFKKQVTNRHFEKSRSHAGAFEIALDRLVTAVSDPDLVTVAAFSAIGLLTAINLILRFPDVGAIIEQYNQF